MAYFPILVETLVTLSIELTTNSANLFFSLPKPKSSLRLSSGFLSFKSANNQFTQYDVLFLPRKQFSQELPREIFKA